MLPLHVDENGQPVGPRISASHWSLNQVAYDSNVSVDEVELSVAWILPKCGASEDYLAWLSTCTPPARHPTASVQAVYLVDPALFESRARSKDGTAVADAIDYLETHGRPGTVVTSFYLVAGTESQSFRSKWLAAPYSSHMWRRTNSRARPRPYSTLHIAPLSDASGSRRAR